MHSNLSVFVFILLAQTISCFVYPRFHRFAKPLMSTCTTQKAEEVHAAIDVKNIEWFNKLKDIPNSYVLDVPEWKDEAWRSTDGFKGKDFIHSPSAAVRIVDYVLLPSVVIDPNGVSSDNFPKLVGPAHFTNRAESHRGLCHGGSFCALMDDVIGWMGFCVSGSVRPWSGYTVQVNTALRKSVPVDSVLKLEAWVKKREGARKYWIGARLVDPTNETCVYCEGEGLFLLSPEQV